MEDLPMLSRREKGHGFARSLRQAAIGWGCLALLLFATGCGHEEPKDTRAADEAAIQNTDAQWAKAAASGDVDATVSYYSDDASLLAPNAPIASDKQSIRAAWASLLTPGTSLSWQTTKVGVARSGDLGYVIGVYQMTTKDAQGKPVSDRGKFVEVWKKQADGNWKTVADIFNSDLPAQALTPAAAAKKKASGRRHTRKRHRANPSSSGMM
jgi:ketosteroid isomerase-like protein